MPDHTPDDDSYSDVDRSPGAVTCTLTDEEIDDRMTWAAEEVLPHVADVAELPAGYAFTFDRSRDALSAVGEFVSREADCCTDLRFELVVPPHRPEFQLRITGPDGTKELARQGLFEQFEGVPRP
jgi:hypothetical protein